MVTSRERKRSAVRDALLSHPAGASNRAIAAASGACKDVVEQVRRQMTHAGELKGAASSAARGAKPVRNWRAGFTLLTDGTVVPNAEAEVLTAPRGRAAKAPTDLTAPFPFQGGKRRVADLVWERFGNVENYVEPFAGSLAVLLRRPVAHFGGCHRNETVNDANSYIANFWRAVRAAPAEVAAHIDWPVNETDLHARHRWLVRSREAAAWRRRMYTDPDYYDARIAGWWAWGQSCWLGSGWCDDACSSRGDRDSRPVLEGRGIVAAAGGRSCDARSGWAAEWMTRLSDRLRPVNVCCGDWSRVCNSETVLVRLGVTGVFLDPPYPTRSSDGRKSREPNLYANDRAAGSIRLRDDVLMWCRKWGNDPKIRAAVCGYEGDGYEVLTADGWSLFSWEAGGGYGNAQKRKSKNAGRERIWFSPACLS